MLKILIVEDEAGIADFVRLELEHEGYETCVASTGREALEKFESFFPDMILLDVMLPELSGLEVLRRIRKTSNVPVILVTARGETYDRVNGLNAGADDYIPKPFEIEELFARMNAVLRRTQNPVTENTVAAVLKNRNLELYTDSMKVLICGKSVNLSKTEFLMLKFFMENINKVLSRDLIINSVWGENTYIDENSVDVYVGYLRSKIDQEAGETYIKTVRGSGYMMIDGSDL